MKKILIVDDEKNIILTLKMYLQKSGYETQVAINGIEAIDIAQDYMPDLIFLDIVLPKMSGYLVCEALKDQVSTKNIPIIFMSAKTQREDIEKALAVGGSDYITKPFTPDQIKKILDKYLKEAI
ncbi:response regulator [Geosporobacter ferrireducens]|uniref:Stage 0 sporulation protein A homolog n=1 Tax=Geosporobacter ferrireducens TaxID=1424294 RepID=A0A1D8GDR5_9FIRM|nr:response regulator [Geosporobacter ferrireducens]AOT69047.1 histidine kinase [Geosporobacter ferrireducens]MTI56715.1 response regulator [Geosporobacter ferrireducens]